MMNNGVYKRFWCIVPVDSLLQIKMKFYLGVNIKLSFNIFYIISHIVRNITALTIVIIYQKNKLPFILAIQRLFLIAMVCLSAIKNKRLNQDITLYLLMRFKCIIFMYSLEEYPHIWTHSKNKLELSERHLMWYITFRLIDEGLLISVIQNLLLNYYVYFCNSQILEKLTTLLSEITWLLHM